MILDYAVEKWSDMIREAIPYLNDHHTEAGIRFEGAKLDMHFERYLEAQRAGCLHCVTARYEGRLVGYCWFTVTQELNDKTTTTARGTVYLQPDYRHGLTGKHFMTHAIATLKPLGVHRVLFDTPTDSRLAVLMASLDMAPVATVYGKVLA